MNGNGVIVGAVILSLLIFGTLVGKGKPDRATTLNRPPRGGALETATFGAGCFWHVEDTFRRLEGVVKTEVGFEGGAKEKPTYDEVSTDRTGHAEVVRVQYDPSRLSYDDLLKTFFELHDPTTLNRQGPDVGIQYRSVVFYHTPAQREKAEQFMAELGKTGRYRRPIVTAVTPASTFWKAEEYHQQYFEKHGR